MEKINYNKTLKCLETKEIDVSRFFDIKEPVKMKIRHYTNWAKNEIEGIVTAGQALDAKTNKVYFAETNFQARVMIKKLLSGVAFSPFDWNEGSIRELDNLNPDLIAFVLEEIEKYNVPLAEQSKQN